MKQSVIITHHYRTWLCQKCPHELFPLSSSRPVLHSAVSAAPVSPTGAPLQLGSVFQAGSSFKARSISLSPSHRLFLMTSAFGSASDMYFLLITGCSFRGADRWARTGAPGDTQEHVRSGHGFTHSESEGVDIQLFRTVHENTSEINTVLETSKHLQSYDRTSFKSGQTIE